jgi:hypothetical protein
LRFVALIVFFREYKILSIYWNAVALGVQFLPLAALLAILHPIRDAGMLSFMRPGHWRQTALAVGVAVGLACFGSCWLAYRPRGETKPGRVLLDDSHSDWAWAGIRMGREDFGSQPTYSYSALKDYLGYFYDLKVNADQTFTPELLREVDVLVLKTPTKPFLTTEGQAIEAFVRRGGGLFLIGDHDNLFGMTSHMNPIAHQFGIRFIADDTFDLTTGGLSFYRPPRFFTHPIVQHVKELGFETTCTLRAWPFAEHAIIGYALGRENADYSHINFFGNIQPDLDEGYGLFLQGVAVRYGRGRVFALADSTIFSNFSLCQLGRTELFLGALDYLNCRNRVGPLSVGFAAAGLAFMALAWHLRYRVGASCSPALLTLSVATGVCLGSGLLRYVHHREYPPASPKRSCPGVAFESEFSKYRLPEMLDFTPPDSEMCYDAFYVNILRLNRFPRIVPGFLEALRGADPVVLINPAGPVTPGDSEALNRFVRGGGRVLLLLGSACPSEASNTLLRPLGVRIEQNARAGGKTSPSTNAPPSLALEITGGLPIAVPKELLPGNLTLPVISEKQVGAGRFIVVAGAEVLSRQRIGPVFYNPDEAQRRLYRLQYFIIDKLLQ